VKVRIQDSTIPVYPSPEAAPDPLTSLSEGQEVEIGAVHRGTDGDYVAVTLPDGRSGYLPGSARILRLKEVTLLARQASIYASPTTSSPIIGEFRKGEKFHIGEVINKDTDPWVKTKTGTGQAGYIPGNTKIKMQKATTRRVISKSTARRNMLVGFLWCAGGLAITAITYSSASGSGGTYVVTWGAIIFGGFQFLQGLVQYLQSKD
jgi:hypothetical protein